MVFCFNSNSLTFQNLQVEFSALADELLTRVHDEERRGSAKVTVVGTGQVGMAAAFAMMTQVCDIYTLHICFICLISFFMHYASTCNRYFPSLCV